MANEVKYNFHSPSFGACTIEDVFGHMIRFRDVQPHATYRLLIGTDSLPRANGSVSLVCAVVFVRTGNGGIYFWTRHYQDHLKTLRQRMYQEALTSIDVARIFVAHPACTRVFLGDVEIHVDIGHRGPTREMIREIVGMVKANGFPVFTKPNSLAASSVADRHTTVNNERV